MDPVQMLADYCQQIQNGEIKACKKHKQAVNRFLRDLEKSEQDDYPYYLDLQEVVDFYEWALLFKHTKGVLAGQHIELAPIQLFIVANIFGWKHKKTGYRRYKKSYIQLARKNTKSQLLALITSYEAFLSSEQGEIYIAGWNKDTSNIVYNEILGQIKACELLQGKYSDSYHQITHLKSGSFIKALSREARRFGDGTNPSFVVVDEFHNHVTSEIYDVLVSGMVARPNGHICIITTAGFSLSGPCYTEYQYIAKILDFDNPIENEEYFALVCELEPEDDVKDESNWIKANPIVATYEEGMNFLRRELKQALDVPEKRRGVYTKNFNIWMESKPNGYLPLDKWRRCEAAFDFEDFRGLPCIVGVDLSAKIDLTSISFLFYKDEHVWVLSHSFMPEDTYEQKRNTDKVPYEVWIEDEYITATPGSVVDYTFLESFIEDKGKEFELEIREICTDPWNGTQFMQNLEAKGFVPVEIRQGMHTLAGPTKDFQERVFSGKVKQNGNPVLSWAIGNAVTKQDANENYMLDKAKATERIDPIAATINAMVRIGVLQQHHTDLNSVIEKGEFSF